jgi:hypothetical protein
MNERQKYQHESLKWLFELDLLSQPQAINTIKLNILSVSERIKEVELLIYSEKKSMLVKLDLTWFGRKFRKKQIFSDVTEMLTQLLPSYKFRITDDQAIVDLAVAQVKRALTGGTNESTTNSSSDPSPKPSSASDTKAIAEPTETVPSDGPDSKEQT